MYIHGVFARHIAIRKETIERIINQCCQANVKVLYPYVTRSLCNREYYDKTMPLLMKEARRRGIEIYLWTDEMKKGCSKDWEKHRQVRKSGSKAGILCPFDPVVRENYIAEILRLVDRYQPAGICLEDDFLTANAVVNDHLDIACFCKYCQANAPKDDQEHLEWNRNSINDFMREVKQRLIQKDNNLKLTCGAPMPYSYTFYLKYSPEKCRYRNDWKRFSDSYHYAGNDWKLWAERKYIDFILPMIYFGKNDRDVFIQLLDEMNAIKNKTHCAVYPLLGADWGAGNNKPQEMNWQIEELKKRKFKAFGLFHWGGMTPDHWMFLESKYGKNRPKFYFF